MKIPTTIPYFKPALGLVLAFGLLWMALEGDLWRDVILAAAVVLLAVGSLIARLFGGQVLSVKQFVFLAAVAGLAAGAALPLVTIFLMALKTGIHAHGPEYTEREIAWVWNQLLVWAGAGAFFSLGVALLLLARRHE